MVLHLNNIIKYFVQRCRDFTLHRNIILSIFIISLVKFKEQYILLHGFLFIFFPNSVNPEGGFLFHVAFSF